MAINIKLYIGIFKDKGCHIATIQTVFCCYVQIDNFIHLCHSSSAISGCVTGISKIHGLQNGAYIHIEYLFTGLNCLRSECFVCHFSVGFNCIHNNNAVLNLESYS